MAQPGFWDRPEDAKKTVAGLKRAKKTLDEWGARDQSLRHLEELLELAEGEGDQKLLGDLSKELEGVEQQVAELELRSLLSGEHDRLGAIVSIHPGAGGTESQDWAEMLFRMYTRWAERRGYATSILDFQPGEEAGVKDATIEIDGEYAYGYLKGESGVHRLVRISPYDAAQRRHTSFASVFVYPMVDDTVTVNISPQDLRVDTFRSSGAGGQHVNKTESAVRITHLPTGCVVSMQDEKSQHKNLAKALRILKSRLYEHYQQAEAAKRAAERKTMVGSGDRSDKIRTYNFPDNRLTDHRIGLTIYKLDQIIRGDFQPVTDALIEHDRNELRDQMGVLE
jgi:peptide chain release factor 2